MFKHLQYTKSIVTVGFIALISLCILGIVLIYKELVKFSEASDYMGERKELVVISNTLAALYKAEGSSNMMIAEALPQVRLEYSSLMGQVYVQIDSLKRVSFDDDLQFHLDSLVVLLNQKEKNTFQMFQLLDSLNNHTKTTAINTSVLSKKDVSQLDSMLERTIKKDEEIYTVKESAPKPKKNFFQRVRSVFDTQSEDSTSTTVLISKNLTEDIDSVHLPLMRDTVVHFITQIISEHDKRNSVYVKKLVIRQNMMHQMNEELTIQINKILRDIELKEYQDSLNLMKTKDITLRRSSKIVSIVGILASFTTILFLILILRSISYSQKYRLEIEKAKKYAEDLLAARERLLLSITHDIKAPISSIIGYMELLFKSKLPEKERYYLENMQNSAEHVLQLVKNLLDYHALESDKQEINKMFFYPCLLLNDILESFMPLADKKGIALKSECNIKRGLSYESDPYRLRQIVNNLLSNALKFTPSNEEVVMSASIQPLDGNGDNDILVLSVKDTGPGISKENQQIIFDEFRRLETGNIEGSGLGLTITRKLVQVLKGTIEVNSRLGEGSEFIVRIPLKRNKNKVINRPEGKDDIFFSMDTNKKILFIDDDVVQLNLYSELLKREGFIPKVCANSIEALSLIQTTTFDMIFTDIQMPDMNGFELVERIRMATFEGAKTIPVIALSASTNISEQRFREAGFSGFLPKPFTSIQMMNMVKKYLGKSEGENICKMIKPADTPAESNRFDALMQFAGEDKEAGCEIIRSFVFENEKNILILDEAFLADDWETIKKVSHKMLPLMRMISASEVVYLLCQFERGLQDKNQYPELLNKVNDLLKEANNFLSKFA